MKQTTDVKNEERILITVEEASYLLHIGMTKCRAFLKEHEREFMVQIGNRKYVNRQELIRWINRETGKINEKGKQRREGSQ